MEIEQKKLAFHVTFLLFFVWLSVERMPAMLLAHLHFFLFRTVS